MGFSLLNMLESRCHSRVYAFEPQHMSHFGHIVWSLPAHSQFDHNIRCSQFSGFPANYTVTFSSTQEWHKGLHFTVSSPQGHYGLVVCHIGRDVTHHIRLGEFAMKRDPSSISTFGFTLAMLIHFFTNVPPRPAVGTFNSTVLLKLLTSSTG